MLGLRAAMRVHLPSARVHICSHHLAKDMAGAGCGDSGGPLFVMVAEAGNWCLRTSALPCAQGHESFLMRERKFCSEVALCDICFARSNIQSKGISHMLCVV